MHQSVKLVEDTLKALFGNNDFVSVSLDEGDEEAINISDTWSLCHEEVSIKTISGVRNRKGWALYRIRVYPATREQPEDCDLEKIDTYVSLNQAVKRLVQEIAMELLFQHQCTLDPEL